VIGNFGFRRNLKQPTNCRGILDIVAAFEFEMASKPQSFPFRPWPAGDRKPKTIAEFIQRVSTERGGFREVTIESLRREIEAQENGVVSTSDVDMDAESDEEENLGTATVEEIQKSREEVLKNITYARLPTEPLISS
jgi:hypothetical protein